MTQAPSCSTGLTSSSPLRQFFPAASERGRSTTFVVTIGTSGKSRFAVGFDWKGPSKKFDVNYNHYTLNNKTIKIDSNLIYDKLIAFARSESYLTLFKDIENQVRDLENEGLSKRVELKRDRFLLSVVIDKFPLLFELSSSLPELKQRTTGLILDVIHLPGLRGNPARTYPVTTIGPRFPGTFENYVASLIDYWGSGASEKIKELSAALECLA